jgi:hypothetical protein
MNLRQLSIFLSLVVLAATARAQVGIYGKFDATHVSTANTNFESTAWYNGAGAGIYYDFFHAGPIGLGADLRGDLLYGNPQKYRDALFGLRLSVKPPVLPIRPYIQGSVGAGGPTHSGLGSVGTIYSNKFQYQILGGVDYALVPHLDWRVAELGYGRMSGISSGAPAPVVTLFSIGSGLVLRFP